MSTPPWNHNWQRPESFVRLVGEGFKERLEPLVSDDGTTHVTSPMPGFDVNAIHLAISREMAMDYGLIEPTAAEAAERAVMVATSRARERNLRAEKGPYLDVPSLLGWLGWSPEFGRHVLHPACDCYLGEGGTVEMCGFAHDLGYTSPANPPADRSAPCP